MGSGFIIIYQVPSHMALHLYNLSFMNYKLVLLVANLSLTGWQCWEGVNGSWTTMWGKVRG